MAQTWLLIGMLIREWIKKEGAFSGPPSLGLFCSYVFTGSEASAGVLGIGHGNGAIYQMGQF